MKEKTVSGVMLTLFLAGILVFAISLDITVFVGKASETIVIRVSPSYTEVLQNTLFNVSILIENVPEDPGVAGVEFKLTWNSSILTGVSMEEMLFSDVPPGEQSNIWVFQHVVSAGEVLYGYTYQNFTRAIERGYLPKSGNGTLAVITFNSTAPGETDLHFSNTLVADPDSGLVSHDAIDGTVRSFGETVIPYILSEIVNSATSYDDNDPNFGIHYWSYEMNTTYSPPDANGVINLTGQVQMLEPNYNPITNRTTHTVFMSDWHGKMYTLNDTGDVDIISMTNDTGTFFWKDGAWHPAGDEWIGDGIFDPPGSAWYAGTHNTSVYLGNGTDGLLIGSYTHKLWITTGYSENTIVESNSRLNGFYVNATGKPFSPPYVGTVGTYVFTNSKLNIPWWGGKHLDEQGKTDQCVAEPPVFMTTLFSPANFYVTDPLNRHIGTNPTTGEPVNEIPGAFYSGPGSHPQRIVIPDPLDGVYDIKIVGTGIGEYTSVVEFATEEKIATHSHTGDIYVGQVIEGEANISEGEMTYTPHACMPPWTIWTHYHNYSEIVETLIHLNSTYPNIVDLFSIGKSWENRDIYCMRLTNEGLTDPKPKMFFVGYHHANELISAELPLYFVVHTATGYGVNATITRMLNYTEIYVVVALNVDGFDVVEANDWHRKNTHPFDEDGDDWLDEDPPDDENGDGFIYPNDEGIDNDGDGLTNEDWIGGVDLNRNYGYHWGEPGTSGSPIPSSQFYRGPNPFSEPETQAIRDWLTQHSFKYALSFHSGLEGIGYPWCYTDTPPPDDGIFREIAGNLSNLVNAPFTQGGAWQKNSGTWLDWMYGNRSTIAFTLEIFSNESAWHAREMYNPGPAEIETVILRWLPVFTYIINRAISEEHTSIPGDINGDTTVNILDAIILAGSFGSEPGDPNWNSAADINNDDVVNILDAIILAGHFGETL